MSFMFYILIILLVIFVVKPVKKILYDGISSKDIGIIPRHELKLLQPLHSLGFNDNIYHESNYKNLYSMGSAISY